MGEALYSSSVMVVAIPWSLAMSACLYGFFVTGQLASLWVSDARQSEKKKSLDEHPYLFIT